MPSRADFGSSSPGIVPWIALAGLALLGSSLFVPLPRSVETPLARHVFDLAHAPLFAAVFLAAWRVLRTRVRRAGLVAALLAVAAAGLSEAIQQLTTREASVHDLLLDAAGIALAWAGVWCWARPWVWRAAHGAVVLGCIVVAGLFLARRASEQRELAEMMPLLAGFETPHELGRWHAKEGTQMRRAPGGHGGSGWALEVSCSARATWPGVSIEDFEGDWRGYRWLEWSMRPDSGEPLEIAVRIDDDQGELYGTRYTDYVPIVPPRQVYRIDLREVARHFPEHPMNMGNVTELHFFLDEPVTDRAFSLDAVRLVP